MGILHIDLLGADFTIKADEDSEYLERLLSYYKQTIEQVERNTELVDQTQISIVAGIMLCDELYKEKVQINSLKKQLPPDTEYRLLKLIQDLDKALE